MMSCRVLIVEDNGLSRDNIARFLKRAGHNVELTVDGESAVELICRMPFDVVVSDLYLPGMLNGIDVLAEQKRANPDDGIILITAFGSDDVKEQADSLGALYFEKPLSLTDLLHQVADLCH